MLISLCRIHVKYCFYLIYLFIYCFCGRSLAHLHLQMFSHCGKTTVLPVLSYIHRYQEVTVYTQNICY